MFSYNEINDLEVFAGQINGNLIEIEHQDVNASLSFRTAMNGLTLQDFSLGVKTLIKNKYQILLYQIT